MSAARRVRSANAGALLAIGEARRLRHVNFLYMGSLFRFKNEEAELLT